MAKLFADNAKGKKEESFDYYDFSFNKLFAAVHSMFDDIDNEDDDFVACIEFFKFINATIPLIKEKSTGKGHAVPSEQAIFLLGKANAQVIYEVVNKFTAYCTGR